MEIFNSVTNFKVVICLFILFNPCITNPYLDQNNYGNSTEPSSTDQTSLIQLSSTTTACEPDLSYNLITQSCIDNETAARIENRPSCKNITLLSKFVEIKNGVLRVTGRDVKFSTDEYIVQSDNSITFCYPFTPKFRSCERWGIYPNEYRRKNGGLKIQIIQSDTIIDTGDFTINSDRLAVICITNSRPTNYVIDAYATSWTISAVSLLISLIVYAIINRKLTYQTKTMMCHMLSLFVFYILLLIRAWGPEFTPTICIGYSVVLHYFFLASFFWINVLAFDIWKNLTRLVGSVVKPCRNRQRFIYMSIYAWGVPVLIAMCGLTTDLLADEESQFKPHFSRQCWFLGLPTKLLFLYGPAAIIVSSNVVFFALTVCSLMRLSSDAVMVNKKIYAQMTRMYMKLLIVMGLCWIMEIVSGVLDKDDRYWYLTDIINGLQGFFLFLVYVCKANILGDLLSLWVKHIGTCRGLCTRLSTVTSRFSARQTSDYPQHAGSVSSLSLPNSETCNSAPISPIPNKQKF